jgi:pentatricopeptide repeat protein
MGSRSWPSVAMRAAMGAMRGTVGSNSAVPRAAGGVFSAPWGRGLASSAAASGPAAASEYNARIAKFGDGGQWERAHAVIEEMSAEGVVPDVHTHSALLGAYASGGQWKKVTSTFQVGRSLSE